MKHIPIRTAAHYKPKTSNIDVDYNFWTKVLSGLLIILTVRTIMCVYRGSKNSKGSPPAKTTEAIPTKISSLPSLGLRIMRVKYFFKTPTYSSTSYVKVTLFCDKNE